MFTELLKIKEMRADKAKRATQDAVELLEGMRIAANIARNTLSKHQIEMRAREEILFERMKGKPVSRRQLDHLKFVVAEDKSRELELREAQNAALAEIPPAEAALEAAKEKQREAERVVAKFEEFVAIEKEDARKAAVFVEDAEIEEVSEAIFANRKN